MKAKFTILRIIHLALTTGAALGAGVFYYMRTQILVDVESGIDETILSPELGFLGVLIVLGGIAASLTFPKIMAKQHMDFYTTEDGAIDNPDRTMQIYQTIKIVQWGILEGGALFAAVLYYLTGNEASILAAALMIGYLGIQRPGLEDLKTRLDLSESDARALADE